jgi:hypothetical protein
MASPGTFSPLSFSSEASSPKKSPTAGMSLQDQLKLKLQQRAAKENGESGPLAAPVEEEKPKMRKLVEGGSFQDQLKNRLAQRRQAEPEEVKESAPIPAPTKRVSNQSMSLQDQIKARAKKIEAEESIPAAPPLNLPASNFNSISSPTTGPPPPPPPPMMSPTGTPVPPPPPPVMSGGGAPPPPPPPMVAGAGPPPPPPPVQIANSNSESPTTGMSLQDQLREKLLKKQQAAESGDGAKLPSTPTPVAPEPMNLQEQLKARLKKRAEDGSTSPVVVEKKTAPEPNQEMSFQEQLKNRLKKRADGGSNANLQEIGSSWKKKETQEQEPVFMTPSGDSYSCSYQKEISEKTRIRKFSKRVTEEGSQSTEANHQRPRTKKRTNQKSREGT